MEPTEQLCSYKERSGGGSLSRLDDCVDVGPSWDLLVHVVSDHSRAAS